MRFISGVRRWRNLSDRTGSSDPIVQDIIPFVSADDVDCNDSDHAATRAWCSGKPIETPYGLRSWPGCRSMAIRASWFLRLMLPAALLCSDSAWRTRNAAPATVERGPRCSTWPSIARCDCACDHDHDHDHWQYARHYVKPSCPASRHLALPWRHCNQDESQHQRSARTGADPPKPRGQIASSPRELARPFTTR